MPSFRRSADRIVTFDDQRSRTLVILEEKGHHDEWTVRDDDGSERHAPLYLVLEDGREKTWTCSQTSAYRTLKAVEEWLDEHHGLPLEGATIVVQPHGPHGSKDREFEMHLEGHEDHDGPFES